MNQRQNIKNSKYTGWKIELSVLGQDEGGN